ncbi:RICIN domain-containing protein [Actinomadura keratinilytica]
MRAANDNADVAAVTYGPVVLSGNYGNTALGSLPSLDTSSITRTGGGSLAFTATADGATVELGPFYDAHGHNYTVYWNIGRAGGTVRLVNAGSGLVLGIQDMSTADGARALQWYDSGTADHDWEIVDDGDAVRLRNAHSGKVLGVQDMSTADGATVLQWSDNGTADHRWTLLDQGDGTYKIRNVHSGKLLGIQDDSTAVGAFAVQDSDDGGADNRWRIVRNG